MFKKIFLVTFLVTTFFGVQVFAAEENSASEENNSVAVAEEKGSTEKVAGYEYTSQTFGFKIVCPAEPKVVVNPFEDPKKRGELLIFASDGADILYGYQIQFEAFDTDSTPDFNKANKKTLQKYLAKLMQANAFEDAIVANITADNKGVFAVTAKEIEIKNDAGEVEDVAVATTQNEFSFFRTKSGRCISIQLITTDLNDEKVMNFRKSVATYQDATDLVVADNSKDKKSKSKKSKK